MSIDLSSINTNISSIVNRNLANYSKNKADDQVLDPEMRIKNQVANMMSSRKGLVDYLNEDESNSSGLYSPNQDPNIQKLLKETSTMKSTAGMSSIDKYKYMIKQAQNMETINTYEPDAEKLLSKSEEIIQRALSEGISATDRLNLSRALNAKQIALSRLDMLA